MTNKCKRTLCKCVSLLLACMIFAGGFSGCKKDDMPPETTTTPPVETTPPTTAAPVVLYEGTVRAEELNVREGVGISYEVLTTLKEGDRVQILEEQDLNGVPWGKTSQGWICLAYVHIDGTPLDEAPEEVEEVLEQPANGTVIATELNVRKGPGINYEICCSLLKDDEITITERKGNWGKTENGWVNMIFVYFPDSLDNSFMITKVKADDLNVRSGPGISYESLRKINTGAEITITKFVTINNVQWGYIGDGWVCMKYVEEAPLQHND